MKKPGEKGYKTIRATEEVRSFCGWNHLREIIDTSQDAFYRALLSILFETGGRISECISLDKHNFDFETNPECIIIREMPLLKRWRKNKTTGMVSKIRDYRTFPIKRNDLLVPYFEDWVLNWNHDQHPFGISRSKGFLIIRSIGKNLGEIPIPGTLKKDGSRALYNKELSPHILRAERACQLVEDYGFDTILLNSFFGWKPKVQSMAERYASSGWIGLARAMGVNI